MFVLTAAVPDVPAVRCYHQAYGQLQASHEAAPEPAALPLPLVLSCIRTQRQPQDAHQVSGLNGLGYVGSSKVD